MTTGYNALANMYLPEQKQCPYCHASLPWIAKRKRACPDCGNSIYVKENPDDRLHYLVTELERDRFEERWGEVWRIRKREEYLTQAEEAKAREDQLTYWHYLAEAAAVAGEHEKAASCFQRAQDIAKADGQYGLLRNEMYALAEMYRKKGDVRTSLENFVGVAYLDYCNVSNSFTYQEELRANKRQPSDAFADLLDGFLDPDKTMAPAVLDWLFELSQEAQLFGEDFSKVSLQTMGHLQTKLRLPFPPSEAWDFISGQLLEYERQRAINTEEEEEEEELSPEEFAKKLHEKGGGWWQFRDLGRALLSEGKRDLAWGSFNRAIVEAAKIGRTCETIYPDMGRQLCKEGRFKYGLELFLMAVHEYGLIAEKFPNAPLDMPKYLDAEITKAIKKLGKDPSQLKEGLVGYSLNANHDQIRARLTDIFGQ